MNRRIVVRPDAVTDILEASDWYFFQQPGLDAEFQRAVEACLTAVQQFPYSYPIIFAGYRRALLARFPYAVIYFVENGPDADVVIVACFHTSREPGRWQQRLN